jgi:hypothetical protein
VNLVEKKASGGSIQSTSKAASDKQKLSYMISLMSEHIMVFPITDALCNTLFDIMLGRTGPKQVIPAVDLFFALSCLDSRVACQSLHQWKSGTGILDVKNHHPLGLSNEVKLFASRHHCRDV